MDKKSARIRRATRARRKLKELGATRLVVHRTPRHIYAQVIAPNGSEVLVAASTVEKAIAEQLKYTGNKDAAAAVGKAVVIHLNKVAALTQAEAKIPPDIPYRSMLLSNHQHDL